MKHLKILKEDYSYEIPSKEEIGNYDNPNIKTLYRVAFKSQLESLFKYGYNRAFTNTRGGNRYGPGVYCTFRLSDTIHNVKTKPEYGDCIVKMRLLDGFKDFLIFDEKIAKEVYGENWEIEKQLKVLGVSEKKINQIKFELNKVDGNLYHGRTAPSAYAVWDILRKNIYQKYNIRGLIYKGNRDGFCVLPYNFSSVIPLSVSFNQGKTFERKLNDDLVTYLNKHADVGFRFYGKYDTVFNSVNGFTVVKKGDKYNIIKNNTNEFISTEWFDKINGNINSFTNMFSFYYQGISFKGTIETYKDDTNQNITGWILDSFDEPFCPFSDLKELADDIKSHGTNSFDMYLDIVEQGDDLHENKKYIRKLIKECVYNILFENRRLVDNFDKVINLMEFNSTDDFYFVQIIKRYKDNPNDDKRKGNYYAGAWYEDSFRIYSAQQLLRLKPEIIKLCDKYNARAYITVNNRSESETNKQIIKVRKMYPKNDARNIHAHEIVPAQAKHGVNWKGQRMKFFVDIDTADRKIWQEVERIAKMCNMDILDKYETPNGGLHIIFPNKEHENIDYFIHMLQKFDNWVNKKRLALAHPNFDGKILLYSNVDAKKTYN